MYKLSLDPKTRAFLTKMVDMLMFILDIIEEWLSKGIDQSV